jgi:hypothetical protein
MFLGPDRSGVALEILAIETPQGFLVIHAMPLRRKYEAEYAAVMRWHEP